MNGAFNSANLNPGTATASDGGNRVIAPFRDFMGVFAGAQYSNQFLGPGQQDIRIGNFNIQNVSSAQGFAVLPNPPAGKTYTGYVQLNTEFIHPYINGAKVLVYDAVSGTFVYTEPVQVGQVWIYGPAPLNWGELPISSSPDPKRPDGIGLQLYLDDQGPVFPMSYRFRAFSAWWELA